MECTKLKLSDKTKLAEGTYPFHIEIYHNDKGTPPHENSLTITSPHEIKLI